MNSPEPDPMTELARLQHVRLRAHRILPPRPLRDSRVAAAFVRERGLVMATGRSALPSLADAIVGRYISGSWLADPAVHRIYDLTSALSKREDVFQVRLVLAKRVVFSQTLGPAVARVAGDTERVTASLQRLSPLAQRLLREVKRVGEVRLDAWDVGMRAAREARLELQREMLVTSTSVHVSGGRHGSVVRLWAQSAIARRFGAAAGRLTYGDACRTLLLAAIRSSVVARRKEIDRWFIFGNDGLDSLLAEGAVCSIRLGRVLWIADAAA